MIVTTGDCDTFTGALVHLGGKHNVFTGGYNIFGGEKRVSGGGFSSFGGGQNETTARNPFYNPRRVGGIASSPLAGEEVRGVQRDSKESSNRRGVAQFHLTPTPLLRHVPPSPAIAPQPPAKINPMVAELQYQELSELAHFERAAALRNQYVWMQPVTGEQMLDYAARFPKDVPKRTGLFSDSQDRGYVRVVQAFWTEDAGHYMSSISYDEPSYTDELGDFLVQKSEEFAHDFGATRISTWLHSDRPELTAAYVRAGYGAGQINSMTALKLGEFDPSPYLADIEEVKANGYELTHLKELSLREPERWQHMYWRHDMDIMADVPLPEPFIDIPFEIFQKDLEAKDTDPSLLFIALKDGEIAGGSGLMQNLVDRTIGNTGLTGTHRGHRRQKLATALKVTALMEAKSRGMEMIFTDNEEKNPMLSLNKALGFKPVLYMQEYRRTLER